MKMTKKEYREWIKSLMKKDPLTITEIAHLGSPGFTKEAIEKRKILKNGLMQAVENGELQATMKSNVINIDERGGGNDKTN